MKVEFVEMIGNLKDIKIKISDCICSLNSGNIDTMQKLFIKSIKVYESDKDDLIDELQDISYKIDDCINSIKNNKLNSIQGAFIRTIL